MAAQERRGAGDPLGEGQMQFCSLHKDSRLLADPLNARPLPIQYWFSSSVATARAAVCLYRFAIRQRLFPEACETRTFVGGLLEEVGFSKSGTFLAC